MFLINGLPNNGGNTSEGMSEIIAKTMKKDLDDADFVNVEGAAV